MVYRLPGNRCINIPICMDRIQLELPKLNGIRQSQQNRVQSSLTIHKHRSTNPSQQQAIKSITPALNQGHSSISHANNQMEFDQQDMNSASDGSISRFDTWSTHQPILCGVTSSVNLNRQRKGRFHRIEPGVHRRSGVVSFRFGNERARLKFFWFLR